MIESNVSPNLGGKRWDRLAVELIRGARWPNPRGRGPSIPHSERDNFARRSQGGKPRVHVCEAPASLAAPITADGWDG